jgi:predicted dehydrogenase
MEYNVGIIGADGIGGALHAPAYHDNSDLEITAVADLDETALAEFGSEWEVPESGRYLSHTKMLASADLDIVCVCTPSDFHYQHTMDALSSSASPDVIFCEKPIATSIEDAWEMVDECDNNGIELVINHTRRFQTEIQTLETLITNDELVGMPKLVTVNWNHGLLRNATHGADLVVHFLNSRGKQVLGGWINNEVDPAVELNEAFDTSTDSTNGFDDRGGVGLLQMQDGTTVLFNGAQTRRFPLTTVDILGTEGRLTLDLTNDSIQFWRLDPNEEYYPDMIETPVPDIDGFQWSAPDVFDNAADHLVNILESDEENVSPGREAAHTLEILVGIYMAHHMESAIPIPLPDPLKKVNISTP